MTPRRKPAQAPETETAEWLPMDLDDYDFGLERRWRHDYSHEFRHRFDFKLRYRLEDKDDE